MREIKFRVWDRRRSQMLYPIEISFDHSGKVTVFYGVDIDEKIACDQAQVMQFTGLLDKNGKEIYEGDLVLVVDDVIVETIGGYPRTEPEGRIEPIEFKDGAFWWGDELLSEVATYGEVIGNIYENPDLIA